LQEIALLKHVGMANAVIEEINSTKFEFYGLSKHGGSMPKKKMKIAFAFPICFSRESPAIQPRIPDKISGE